VNIIERASEQIVNQKKKLTLFLIERILALISLKSKELSSIVVEVGAVPSGGLALSSFFPLLIKSYNQVLFFLLLIVLNIFLSTVLIFYTSKTDISKGSVKSINLSI
jgi:hypothetical protein